MPPEAIPFVAAAVGFFATFIVVVGGASLWTAMPRRSSPVNEIKRPLPTPVQAAATTLA